MSARSRRLVALALCPVGLLAACERAEPVLLGGAERARSATGFTLTTEDGTEEIVLAGVIAPDRERHPDSAGEARAALDARLGEGQVSVRPASEPERDRYDRLRAEAKIGGADLAATLVAGGWLMTWPRAGDALDFDALYAAEAEAREASRGAWADGAFAIVGPDPNDLSQRLDSPVIVEGLVAATGEARDGRVFVNFGLDWRTDFTATANREARAVFDAAGVDLAGLDGAQIRVRGWLYDYNGPAIDLVHPAQIEIVDGPDRQRIEP